MAKNDMYFYATLEEAIDAAREVFLADNPVWRLTMPVFSS